MAEKEKCDKCGEWVFRRSTVSLPGYMDAYVCPACWVALSRVIGKWWEEGEEKHD